MGNRLNLPNAATDRDHGACRRRLSTAQSGVASGLPDPLADVVPVRVNLTMSSLDVADAIRVALADHLGNGNVDAIKVRNEAIQIIDYWVDDPGPLGLSGPSDPTTGLAGTGLFGDQFGAFNAEAGPNGQVTAATPGALRMWDNQHEGVYIDNLVIGFASRGEMVTGSSQSASPQFVANTAQPGGEIDEGEYQLEVRQATEYGLTVPTLPNLFLFDGFDVNDRLVDGVTLTPAAGDFYRDGQSFTISDGTGTVTFEFEDVTVENGVAAGNTAILFDPSDSDVVMAQRIRDAINAAADAGRLAIRASAGDGVFDGPDKHEQQGALVRRGAGDDGGGNRRFDQRPAGGRGQRYAGRGHRHRYGGGRPRGLSRRGRDRRQSGRAAVWRRDRFVPRGTGGGRVDHDRHRCDGTGVPAGRGAAGL